MKDKKNISNNYLNLENTYINLPKNMFSYQEPHKVPSPKSVAFNKRLAQYLGLNEEFLQSDEGIEFLCGNGLLKDTTPISQAYAGHQFGYFTMLGDGRAVLLGEFISKDNERFDLQLKGSGVTPYSRGGDGKATLGPMLREYIISEGMYALGIPTTRSLSVVSTGEEILREKLLPGAVLARIAKSHIRVGTFQYAANYGSLDDLKSLADYTLDRHFKGYENAENKYVYLLNEVIKRQAELIAKWQLVGFIHGVMNTDNVSISGETIDYGPCAFMDIYDPDTVFSSIDREGRYSYINQPKIGIWNLARFAETLLPLLDDNKDKSIEIAESSLSSYSKLYSEYFENGMRKKLGIFNEEANDFKIFSVLFGIMKEYNADFTNTFYYLTTDNLNEMDMFNSEDFKKWYTIWQERLSRQSQSKDESKKLMQDNNPVVIPRNHKVEEALSSAVNDNDYSIMQNLLNVLKNPYDYNNINKAYMELPPKTSCKYKTFCGT